MPLCIHNSRNTHLPEAPTQQVPLFPLKTSGQRARLIKPFHVVGSQVSSVSQLPLKSPLSRQSRGSKQTPTTWAKASDETFFNWHVFLLHLSGKEPTHRLRGCGKEEERPLSTPARSVSFSQASCGENTNHPRASLPSTTEVPSRWRHYTPNHLDRVGTLKFGHGVLPGKGGSGLWRPEAAAVAETGSRKSLLFPLPLEGRITAWATSDCEAEPAVLRAKTVGSRARRPWSADSGSRGWAATRAC